MQKVKKTEQVTSVHESRHRLRCL